MRAQQLKSGSFRVVVSDGYDENGKRCYKSFTADEQWKALKMAEDFKKLQKMYKAKEKKSGKKSTHTKSSAYTLRKAFKNYIDTRSNVVEPTTIRNYEQIAEYCFQCIMDHELKTLTVLDIQYAVNEESKRVSPKYVKNAYGLLKSVLKIHEINLNLSSIKLPKLKKKQKELPPFEQIFQIVKGTDSELPVLLAAWLSLRIGEVVGLQFRDVDMENHRIHVRRTIIKTNDGYVVREGCKTEKSTRDIHIPDYILELIQAQPHEADTDFIIPRTAKSVYNKYKRLMMKNGMDLTFHSLRHINASVMLMLNIPDKYAMERGGWATDNVLKSVYQQTYTSMRQTVDEKIDDYFNGIVNAENEAVTA